MSFYISLWFDLHSFFTLLSFKRECWSYKSCCPYSLNKNQSYIQLWTFLYKTMYAHVPAQIWDLRHNSFDPIGWEVFKLSTLLFLTYSAPNFSPPFIHHCPLSPPSVCLSFIWANLDHPPLPMLYSVLSLNADIIYQSSSSSLISQHKSLSLLHPSLTLHPGLYSSSLPASPRSFLPVFFL